MIHILVVDDDEKLNRALCTYLRANGYEAKGVLSASDAYDEMYTRLYDFIISDIMMPGIDGFEFAKTVRELNKSIPLLFMSARDDLAAKREGFQIGIDDYIVKPFELDELLLRVQALLRRAHIEQERRLIVGNLTLDADAMTASAGGEEIALTTRSSWTSSGAWRARRASAPWTSTSRSCATSSPAARALPSKPCAASATRR